MTFACISFALSLLLCLVCASPHATLWMKKSAAHRRWEALDVWLDRHERLLFALLLFTGIALRVLFLVLSLDGSVTPEEALTGVQAHSLFSRGKDVHGVFLPAYSQGWGGMQRGMLLPLVCAAFIALLGNTALALRLPMLLMSVGQMGLIAAMVRRAFGAGAARIALLILAFMPWHVLSCTYASSMQLVLTGCTLGAYCALRSFEKPRFAYVAAACFALTLYAGDSAFFPCTGLFFAGVLAPVYMGRGARRNALGATALWLVLSLPALATALVQVMSGTSFSLLGMSIPRFEHWEHAQESVLALGVDGLYANLIKAVNFALLSVLEDAYAQASMYVPADQGVYCAFLIPAALAGAALCFSRVRAKQTDCKRRFAYLLLTTAALGSLLGVCVLGVADTLHMFPLQLSVCVLGIAGFAFLARRIRIAGMLVLCMSVLSFVPFASGYVNGAYREEHATSLATGFAQAARAMGKVQAQEYIVTENLYPHVNPGMAARMEVAFAWDVLPDALENVRVTTISDSVFAQDGIARAYIVHERDWENISVELDDYALEIFGCYMLIVPAQG